MEIIRLNEFSCFYRNKKEYVTVLDKVSFSVERGEFLVVIGESGCGKTTLLRACLGLAQYYDGELFVDGVSIDDVDLKRGRYAYVSQEIGLYPNLTVYKNIAFPLSVTHTSPEEIDKRVKRIASELDIDFLLSRKPSQLSIGQQQRAAIARALIKDPTIIYFDEPFSNLDPALRSELRAVVKKLHGAYGVTVVFVTHDIGEALALADRIAVLEKGSLLEIGTPEYLLENGKSELIKGFLNK
ncbi:MAG: ABC transporter ATP-binding protein [Clostridia bacterium]|nr:ABC transporter ATP-binding protein [Clostridia bacterium]